MNLDETLDHNYMRVKEKLNQEKIKLWLPPFLNCDQNKNYEELKKLADTFSQQLLIEKEICLQYLDELQTKALCNFKERENYRNTGQAALKIRVPNEHGGSTLTIAIELSKTGLDLRREIALATSVTPERLKVIFKGKFLNDESTLEEQGIKHGLHIMAIIVKEKSESISAENDLCLKKIDSAKADIALLSSNSKYLQVADQSGKLLKLPVKERKSLITAMALHEKGRAVLKNQDFPFALLILLEAEKEFCQCDSSLLKSVDNYGVLSLDIVWCYLNLNSVTQLPDAEKRLWLCEESFKQSYGSNLERLSALKGFVGNESALFMRLHLLQAIVLYHQNKINEARILLEKAEEELMNLKVDDNQLCQLIELGYNLAEARLALRGARGNINVAISIIENKKAERKRHIEREKHEKQLFKKRKKLGKCLNGEWVDLDLHHTLISMGLPCKISKWALAQCNNNITSAIALIYDNSEKAFEESLSSETQVSDKVKSGSDKMLAKLALNNNTDKSSKVPDDLSHSQSDDDDDDDDDDDNEDEEEEEEEEKPNSDDGLSLSNLKQKREEAYTRLTEGLSRYEEDHLDLDLVLESEYLKKYKGLLLHK